MMARLSLCTLAIALLAVIRADGLKVLLTNDDGWAIAQIRAQFNTLENAGMDVVLSAPAEDASGTGSISIFPDFPPLLESCEFDSCPTGSPGTGSDASDPRLNYVNGFPADAVKFALATLTPQFFDGPPDIVVSGPNAGFNTEIQVLGSGTVGAAAEGAKQGIPSIAFSGHAGQDGFQTLQTDPTSSSTINALVFAQRAAELVEALAASGSSPLLPSGTILNVNFPTLSSDKSCTQASDIKFVLTRVFPAIRIITPSDVVTCGNGGRLPKEDDVAKSDNGCFASISVVDASSKLDATKAQQAVVLSSLSGILTCFSG